MHAKFFPQCDQIDIHRRVRHLSIQIAHGSRGRGFVAASLLIHRPVRKAIAALAQDGSHHVVDGFAICVCSRMRRSSSRQNIEPPQYVRPQVWVTSKPWSPASGWPCGRPPRAHARRLARQVCQRGRGRGARDSSPVLAEPDVLLVHIGKRQMEHFVNEHPIIFQIGGLV